MINKKWNSDNALEKLKELKNKSYFNEPMSETDTRSKMIDFVLIDVLGWSEDNILREERCLDSGKYLDYKISTNTPRIIIEAKKSSINFDIPTSSNQREYKIGGVIKQCEILTKAINQARDYALSKGIIFCVVTNGHQYVFFRSQNSQGVDWNQHKVIVFRDLKDIESNFELFSRLLSKSSAENGLIERSLRLSDDTNYEINKYKTLDTRHLIRPRKIDRNPLFPFIGEIVRRVFQDLASEESESEILEHCYVDSPNKKDKSTPFMDREIKLLYVSKKDAGDFQQRITSSLTNHKVNHTEVILLIGSVGVGKSTFLQRFRKVLAKKEIDNAGIWIYLNFKHYSDTGEILNDFIYSQIEETLNAEYSHLDINDWAFLKQAYHSEYENLKKGALAPLFKKDPNEFDLKFGEKIYNTIENDKGKHCTNLLSAISKRLKKSIFLVFDNADQLDPKTQNQIFLASQKLAETIKCYALIAMREESYWKNRDSGPLNAFHTTAYHVQPPTLKQVISKRFQYARTLIRENKIDDIPSSYQVTTNELLEIFNRLVKTLLGTDENYIRFIESISSRDIRRALDTIAAFMISGHTNIEAILRDIRRTNSSGFPIPFHEFLNAIILRDHEVFSETLCDTINLFNITGSIDVSNFNRIAVLGRIMHAQNSQSSSIGNGYLLIEEVINDCHSVGILPETTVSILNTLNGRRLIETETTIKENIDDSKYVRITISGKYYIEELSKLFGYLDLIIYETPICQEPIFKKLNKINGEIISITSQDGEKRILRVEKRLELCKTFIDYLLMEFNKCSFRKKPDLFSSESISLIQDIKLSFESESIDVLNKAKSIFEK